MNKNQLFKACSLLVLFLIQVLNAVKFVKIEEAYYGVPREIIQRPPLHEVEFDKHRKVKSIVKKELVDPKIASWKKDSDQNPYIIANTRSLGKGWMNKMFGDPVPKERKALLIVYSFGEKHKKSRVAVWEDEDLIFPLTLTPESEGGLHIVSAIYKSSNKSKNVTSQLKSMAIGDCYYHPRVNGWMNYYFGDPDKGKTKTLEIRYIFKENEFVKEVKENNALLLPDLRE